jgi:hypothetical protein
MHAKFWGSIKGGFNHLFVLLIPKAPSIPPVGLLTWFPVFTFPLQNNSGFEAGIEPYSCGYS